MNLEFIFKVIDKDEWQKAKQSGTYGGSEKDLKDGYIHFSEEDQVKETLNKHYPKKENLVLLRVNAFKLEHLLCCLLYTSPSPRDGLLSRMPSSA